MDSKTNPTVVADDVVVSMEYTLKVDGEVVDSSVDDSPLEFLQGHGNIIKGLESALAGLKPGDTRHVSVTPADGYGEYDQEQIVTVPRREFPAEIPLKPGVELEVTDDDGEIQSARIVRVEKDNVRLDFNHPLAGKTLEFDITIVDLRHPTTEELDHGHVHSSHNHDDDDLEYELEDFEDEDEDFEDEDDEFDEDDDELEYVDDEDFADDFDEDEEDEED